MSASYMSNDEIKQAAEHLKPLLRAVLEHNPLDRPRTKRYLVYLPPHTARRVVNRAARQLKIPDKKGRFNRPSTSIPGVAFTYPGDKHVKGGVVVIDKQIRIVSQYQSVFDRPSAIYIAHEPADYIRLCLADRLIATREQALMHIDNLRYALERRLPTGHPLQRPSRNKKAAVTA